MFWISDKWGDKIGEFATEGDAMEAFHDITEDGARLMFDNTVLAVR